MGSRGPAQYLHSYHSSRPWVDWNRCGQAAVATIYDYYGSNPYGLEKPVYDAKDDSYHWEDGKIIDRIKEDFPPNHAFGLLGTSAQQIARALEFGALETRIACSRDTVEGRKIWEDVKRYANDGHPVIVIMDRGKLGGRPFAAHWGVVHSAAECEIRLANTKNVAKVRESVFLRAFACRFMPSAFNHCAIFSRPGQSANAPPTG